MQSTTARPIAEAMDAPSPTKLSPFEQAKAVYDREPSRRTFWDDLTLHLLNGFVFSTPDYFVMGRPVLKDAAPEFIVDPHCKYPKEQADCWMIYLMAGDTGKAWDVLPWDLEFICFERNNELRFHLLEDVIRHSPEKVAAK